MNLPPNRTIHITRAFSKDLKKLPKVIQRQCWEIANILAKDVFDPTLDIRKLHGYENVWRTKVKRSYRLIYTFDDNSLYLLRIAHRKDIYKKPFDDIDI